MPGARPPHLKHVVKIKSKGRTYYYHRVTKQRLPDNPNSLEFRTRVTSINRTLPQRGVGRGEAIKRERVYFARSGVRGPIKIGRTVYPVERRLKELQIGNPRKIELLGWCFGGADLEASLHAEFAHLHLQGEWFQSSPELTATIRELHNKRRRPDSDSPSPPRGRA